MIRYWKNQIANLLHEEEGAIMVEYVLLLLLVTMTAFLAMKFFGASVTNTMGNNNSSVTNAIN